MLIEIDSSHLPKLKEAGLSYVEVTDTSCEGCCDCVEDACIAVSQAAKDLLSGVREKPGLMPYVVKDIDNVIDSLVVY